MSLPSRCKGSIPSGAVALGVNEDSDERAAVFAGQLDVFARLGELILLHFFGFDHDPLARSGAIGAQLDNRVALLAVLDQAGRRPDGRRDVSLALASCCTNANAA